MTSQTSSSDKNIYCGQSLSGTVSRECLSPLPVSNGRPIIEESAMLRFNKNGLLELNLNSGNVLGTKVLLFLHLAYFSFIFTLFIYMSFSMGFEPFLAVVIGFVILSVAIVGGPMFFGIKDNIFNSRNNFPLLFDCRLNDVIFSWVENNSLKRPSLLDSNILFFCFGFGVGFLSLGITFFLEGKSSGQIMAIIGSVLLIFPIKPWVVYFYKLRHKKENEIRLARIPWEKVRVEYQTGMSFHVFGTNNMHRLCFFIQVPEKREGFFSLSMPVFSREEALSTYEFIRDYMENGCQRLKKSQGNYLKDKASNYSLAFYKERIAEYRKEKVLPVYLLWRLVNILTFTYWVRWYLELLNDVLPQKNPKKAELERLCSSVAEADWVPMNPVLKEVNERVRSLYANGHRWEDDIVQAVIREYDDITAEKYDFDYVDEIKEDKK